MNHECGVLGLYNVSRPAIKAFYGLFALQHRGQESCGIYISDENEISGSKDFGMVRNVFDDAKLEHLEERHPKHAIGHVRYSPKKENVTANLQPMLFHHMRADFALCSNGSLVNHEELKQELQERGAIFQSNSNCEILAHLLVQHTDKFLPALKDSLNRLVGSFCFVILRRDKLYAMRDPLGIFPLAIAKLGDGYVVSSETCAFDLLGAEYIRDVEPGEIIEIREEGLFSHRFTEKRPGAICLMEYIYFARPDSQINGVNVHVSRFRAGAQLAKESPADVDLVVGVPESSLSAAHGYAAGSGIPYDLGLLKNKYSGRTFIESTQERRDLAVYLKLSPIRPVVEGKRIVLVDDSIVRGTTSKQLISMMRAAGATEVHMRIASPKMIAPCFYGVDTSSYDQLIGSQHSVEEICQAIGADSLAFLSNEGLREAIGLQEVCDACFTEHYPTELYNHAATVQQEIIRRAMR